MSDPQSRRTRSTAEENEILLGVALFLGLALLSVILILGGVMK